ncbi:putative Caltractin ICL1d [Cardiosporidium cionae]|uniref:Calmodulin n=1 Tax=Cardiosporidium cionae TaxID=476202 RepID=A0ABQ7JCN3_9APIC|nr:putative Caltractin ICL1d [Cardiosporidium cionae]|eukprot:KAF8821685.1 putative Caltractin ICL1d [Cardiosporidium cionae]
MDLVQYLSPYERTADVNFPKHQGQVSFQTSRSHPGWNQYKVVPPPWKVPSKHVAFAGNAQKKEPSLLLEPPGFVDLSGYQHFKNLLDSFISGMHSCHIFSLFENRNEGFIWKSDLSAYLKELNYSTRSCDSAILFTELNKLESKIKFSEFLSLFSIPVQPFSKIEDAHVAFKLFDVNHTGSVSVNELASINNEINYKASASQLQNMIKSVDSEGDGAITLAYDILGDAIVKPIVEQL